MKISFLAIFGLLILSGCGEDISSFPNVSKPNPTAPATNTYSASVLGTANFTDIFLSMDASSGSCTFSSDKRTLTYTLNDLSYTGTDSCWVVWDALNGCGQTFNIDFSSTTPQLIGSAEVCND